MFSDRSKRENRGKMATTIVIPCMKYLLFLVLIMVNLPSQEVCGDPVDAEVKQFPDFDGPLPSKHYAG